MKRKRKKRRFRRTIERYRNRLDIISEQTAHIRGVLRLVKLLLLHLLVLDYYSNDVNSKRGGHNNGRSLNREDMQREREKEKEVEGKLMAFIS